MNRTQPNFRDGNSSTRKGPALRRPFLRRRRDLLVEHLEDRRLLASDLQNSFYRLDVDDDTFIAPVDALIVINFINSHAPLPTTPAGGYIDVDGDGQIAPIDALLVINHINAHQDLPMTLALASDAGNSATDGITNDPTLAGNVKLAGANIAATKIRFGDGPIMSFPIDGSGNFQFDPRQIAPLAEGLVGVALYVEDASGAAAERKLQFTLDTIVPMFTPPRISAADDTGLKNNDNITQVTSPHITLTGQSGEHLRVTFDGVTLFDGTSPGDYAFQPTNLADGVHPLFASISDVAGNAASTTIQVVVDTTPPPTPTFDLAPTSDSGIQGDRATANARVTLIGTTEGNSFVTVTGGGTTVRTGGDGKFRIPELPLSAGINTLNLSVSDLAGNSAIGSGSISRVNEAVASDPVLRWDQAMLNAIVLDATPPPVGSRDMAMVSIAMLDVVNAIEGTPAFLVSLPAPAGISPEAAVSTAAYRVMNYLYPGQAASIQAVQDAALADIPAGDAKTQGIAFGTLVGDAVFALRDNDGWNQYVDYTASTAPGQWQETAPMYDVALLPQWAQLTPFAVSNVAAVMPMAPPSLTSQTYADSVNEIKNLGKATGSTRTPDQTQIARFWADGSGTYSPPGHWNQIAAQFAAAEGLSLGENARLFAMLNAALGDAAIVAWNAKYAYNFWRPITAIQNADLDGNALTAADPTWSPLLITPNFPEYLSGHSTFSAAAAEVLTQYFGDGQAFSTTSVGLPGVTRNFTSFNQAAAEAGRSRIYGGIHYEFTNQASLAVGHNIGRQVLDRFTVADDMLPPQVVFVSPPDGSVVGTSPTIEGWALDNLAGVSSATAQLDNGTEFPVALDAAGRFTFEPSLALTGAADGPHVVHVRATDKAGLASSNYDFHFTLDTQRPTLHLTAPTTGATVSPDQRLVGAVNGTGTGITSLTYQIDNGPKLTLTADADGAFDQGIDLWRTIPGGHTLTVRAQDAAGLTTTVMANFTLSTASPLQISTISPTDGAGDVGTTFRPEVRFSRPIDPTTITTSNFYATNASGQRIPAAIVPAKDGSFAWLFFTSPLPGGATVTVHVSGGTIHDTTGASLDADGDGQLGGELKWSFSTVSLTPLAGTSLTGRIVDPGDDLKPMTYDDIRAGADGVLHTADDVFLKPIAYANVYILGLQSQGVFTDDNGFFTLPSVPAGDVKLVINGRTATNSPVGAYWPEMTMDLDLEAGRVNTVMGTMGSREEREANLTRTEVYLPRVQNSILQTISPTQTTTVKVDGVSAPNLSPEQRQQLQLQVQPGSVIGADGLPLANPQVGISTVPPQLVRDMLPPGVLQHTFDITIQSPDAAVFNTPLQITFPNVFSAQPGEKLNFLSFDHTTGKLVIEGTATVSADGLSVVTDPGVGITKPGWHGITQQGGCGASGDPPRKPDRKDDDKKPEDSEFEADPTAIGVLISDDDGSGGTGAQGESSKQTLLHMEWSAPGKPPDPNDPKKPDPPPLGTCPAPPPPPPKPDEKLQTPYLQVKIEIDGPLKEFADSNGDVPLTSTEFKLMGGSKETRKLDASLKSIKDLFGSMHEVNDNQLYGAKIKVTEDYYDEHGTRGRTISTQYVYAFIDATDDNHKDQQIAFENVLGGQAISRIKTVQLHVGQDSLPQVKATGDAAFAASTSNSQVTIAFTPSSPTAGGSGELKITAPGKGQPTAMTIGLKGKAVDKQTIVVNSANFVQQMLSDYTQGKVPDSVKAAVFEDNGVLVTGKVQRFVADVIADAQGRAATFSTGINITTSGSGTAIRVDNFTFNGFNNLLAAVDNTPEGQEVKCPACSIPEQIGLALKHQTGAGGGILGKTFTSDPNWQTIVDVHKNFWKEPIATSTYRVAQAIHSSQSATVVHDEADFYKFAQNAADVYHTLVSLEAHNILHEAAGHGIGLPHRNGSDPIDIMAQGIDPNHTRVYHSTAVAIPLSLGLSWDEDIGNQALELYMGKVNENDLDNTTSPDIPEYPPPPSYQPNAPVLDIVASDGSLVFQGDFGQNTLGQPNTIAYLLKNSGDKPAHIHSIAMGDVGFSTTAPASSLTLDPGQTLPISVTFNPEATGTYSGHLVIASDALTPQIRVPFTGTARTTAAHLSFAEIDNNVGSAQVGQAVSAPSVFTITNQGAAPLVISAIAMIGSGGPFSLSGVPADLASQPLSLAYGERFTFGATFAPEKLGLQRGFLQIATNDPTQPLAKVSLVGTGIDSLPYPQWGKDYVAIGSQNVANAPVLRSISDGNGYYSFFLPPLALYHEAVFDPATGLIAHGYGRTGATGGSTDLSSTLVFKASTASDSDFDGLPDDVEFAIGTAPTKADSDQDALDDYTEVAQGLDPLTGRNLPLATIAAVSLKGSATDVSVEGSPQTLGDATAYVATGDYGLALVDVSDAIRPIVKSELDLPGYSSAVAVDTQRKIALVAANEAGLQFVDVSNPKQPVLINTMLLDGPVTEVLSYGGVAYAAVGTSLESIDLSTYEVLETLPNEYVRSLAREGDKLYVLGSSQLQVIDLAGYGMVPRGQTSVSFVAEGPTSLSVGNGIVYIAREQTPAPDTGGYATYDVSNPDQPALISSPDVPAGVRTLGSGLALNGSGLGLLFDDSTSNIDVMDTSDAQQTYLPLIRLNLPAPARAVAAAGGFAFLAEGTKGLQVINYSNADLAGIPPTVSISTPAPDAAPGTPGLQVFEGATLAIQATVKDDVRAHDVELLVDGVVVQDDVSYPWDFAITAPKLSAAKTSFTVQVRATDTGGNTTLSAPLTIGIVADTAPPTVANATPAEGSILTDLPSLRINFDKPLDAATLSTTGITLTALGPNGVIGGGDDSVISLRPFELRNLGRTLIVAPAASLAPGKYQFQLAAGSVQDRVGNPLSSALTRNFTMQSGVLSLGREIRGFISSTGQQDIYHFNGLAGQQLFLDSFDDDSEPIYARLTSPSGVTIWKFDAPLTIDSVPFSLVESGNYTLKVYGQNNATGDYDFRLLDAASAPLISIGQTLTANLSPLNRTDLYRISGQAATRLAIDHQGTQPLDSRISIYTPGNNQVYVDSDRLPSDGTYLVAVTAGYGQDPLTYKFSLVAPGDAGLPLTLGQTISETISQVGERDHYTFQGAAGQRLFFDALDGTASGLVWSLTDPSGNLLSYYSVNATADADPVVLTQTGKYDLVLQSTNEATGVYRFRVVDLATVPTIQLNTLMSGTMNPPKQAQVYQFQATAGTYLYFANYATGGDYSLTGYRLYGPSGKSVSDWNSYSTSDQSLVLPASGTYYFVVGNAQSNQATAFNYSFHLDTPAVTTTPTTLGVDVTGTFSLRGEVRSYSFAGTAGQQILIDSLDNVGNTKRLIAPSGTEVTAIYAFSSSTDYGPVTLAETGTYRVEIRPAYNSTYVNVPNTYRFRVLDLASAILLPPATPTTASFATGMETAIYRFTAGTGQQVTATKQNASRQLFGSERWSIYDQQGRQLASVSLGTNLVADLPAAGTYYLLVAANSSNRPLDYQFQLALTTSPSVNPSGLGTTVTGTVAANTQKTVNFAAAGGTIAYIDFLPGNTGSMTSSLRDPNNNSLTTFSNATFSDVGPITLPQSGSYAVQIPTSPASFRSGNYAFKVIDVAAAAAPMTLGIPISGTVGANETVFFRFIATAGQRIYVDRLSSFSSYLTAYTPEGRVIPLETFSYSGLQTLAAGTYYVVLQNTDSSPTNYSFRLVDTATAQDLAFDTNVTAALNATNQASLYKFQATTGDRFLLHQISGYDSDLGATLYGPDGQAVSGVGIYSDSSVTLAATGTYALVFDSSSLTGPVNYQFLARREAPTATPIQLGTLITDTTVATYEQRRFSFTAAAGTRLYYDAIQSNHVVTILGPSGQEVATPGNYDDALPPLPETGTYTILVQYGTGPISFRLLDVSLAPAVPLNVDTTANFTSSSAAAQIFKFHGTAGQRFFFDNRSFYQQTTVNVLDPANNSISSGYFDFDFATPQDADYLLVITQSYVTTFPFLFATLTPNIKPLTVNTLTTGSIDKPGQQDIYTFQGTVGQRLAWDAGDDDFGHWIPVQVVSPSGALVLSTNTYQGNEPAPFTLTESGAYQLIVGGDDVLAPYHFQLLDAATLAGLTLETDVSGMLNPALSDSLYRFTGQAGQRLYFDATAFSSISGTWLLYGPGNQQLASAQFSGDMELVLPATGQYLLQLAGRGSGQITYAFHVYTPVAPVFALVLNAPTAATLSKPGQIDSYKFTGAPGDRLFYDAIDGGGAAMNVQLLDPNNQVVTGISGDAHVDHGPITLAIGGTYRLVVDGSGAAIGDYKFRLLNLADAPQVTLGATLTADVTPGYETDIYALMATAGESLTFDMLSAAPTNGFWKLFGPGNQSFNSANLPNDFMQSASATGTYMLIVSGNSATPINYQFRVTSPLMLAGDAPQPAIATTDRLDVTALAAIVAEANAIYAGLGLASSALNILSDIRFHIVSLSPGLLGQAGTKDIWIDDDAGGQGWFIDSTPSTDEEFFRGRATPASDADEHVDLLTVVLHELGHLVGLEHSEDQDDVMFAALLPGHRKKISAADADALFSTWTA